MGSQAFINKGIAQNINHNDPNKCHDQHKHEQREVVKASELFYNMARPVSQVYLTSQEHALSGRLVR